MTFVSLDTRVREACDARRGVALLDARGGTLLDDAGRPVAVAASPRFDVFSTPDGAAAREIRDLGGIHA